MHRDTQTSGNTRARRHEEGFTDVQITDLAFPAALAAGKADMGNLFPQAFANAIQTSSKVIGLGGLHPGCRIRRWRSTGRRPSPPQKRQAIALRENTIAVTTRVGPSARSRLDLPLVACASGLSVVAAFAVAAGVDLSIQVATGALYTALVAALLAFVRRLELSLYALVLLLTAVRIEPAPVDFMVLGLIGALALRGELWRFHPPRIVVIGAALMLGSYVVALALAPSPVPSARYAAATLLVVVTGYVAFQLASREPRIMERAWVVAAVLIALEATAALLPIHAANVFHGSQVLRVQGLFKDPNVFGPFAVPAVLLLCMRWPTMPIALRTAGLVLALVPVAASLSRGAVVVLVVSLVVLVGSAASGRWRPTMFALLAVLGVAAIALLVVLALPGSPLGTQRGLTTQPLLFFDLSIRFAGQLAGLNYLAAHPLSTGVGPGNYEPALGQPSHETYLRMLVETGPLSLIALILLFWAALRPVRTRDSSAVAWVAALVGFAVAGLFIDTLHWRHLWVVMAMPLAIAAHRGRQRAEGTERPGMLNSRNGS